jgi:hypothetical protein
MYLSEVRVSLVLARVARFFLVQHTKTENIYQMTTKYTKRPKSTPNGCKIDQMSIKYTNIFHCKTLKNYPNLDFWFENIPSGNPGFGGNIKSKT